MRKVILLVVVVRQAAPIAELGWTDEDDMVTQDIDPVLPARDHMHPPPLTSDPITAPSQVHQQSYLFAT